MIPVWPAELPKPQRSSFQKQLQDPRIKKRAETGPPGYKRRFSSVSTLVSLSIKINREQLAVFETFHEVDTQMGALPFLMPDPITDGWPLLAPDGNALLAPDDEPILIAAHWLVLFGENMPAISKPGLQFVVTFPVSVMP
ncbi:hypothetical protein ABVF61_00425 [Roseibium sp. HPY-6]|uniref:hypothetical protein n=1 Tax=Roseibium sp. HPY-6 TaxID=3229852 RepID=UPI00338FFE81